MESDPAGRSWFVRRQADEVTEQCDVLRIRAGAEHGAQLLPLC